MYMVLKEHSGRDVESCTEFSLFSDTCLVPYRHAPPPRDCVACGRGPGGYVVTVRTQAAAPAQPRCPTSRGGRGRRLQTIPQRRRLAGQPLDQPLTISRFVRRHVLTHVVGTVLQQPVHPLR
jgi:hypothetical protein